MLLVILRLVVIGGSYLKNKSNHSEVDALRDTVFEDSNNYFTSMRWVAPPRYVMTFPMEWLTVINQCFSNTPVTSDSYINSAYLF